MAEQKKEQQLKADIIKEFGKYCGIRSTVGGWFPLGATLDLFFQGHMPRGHTRTVSSVLAKYGAPSQGYTVWGPEKGITVTVDNFWSDLKNALINAGEPVDVNGTLAGVIKKIQNDYKLSLNGSIDIGEINKSISSAASSKLNKL